jgi:hypothetical protein
MSSASPRYPADFLSAQHATLAVGYVREGVLLRRNLPALLLDLAIRGYLDIEQNDGCFYLHRTAAPPVSQEDKLAFEAIFLFSAGKPVKVDPATGLYGYDGVQDALYVLAWGFRNHLQLAGYFSNAKAALDQLVNLNQKSKKPLALLFAGFTGIGLVRLQEKRVKAVFQYVRTYSSPLTPQGVHLLEDANRLYAYANTLLEAEYSKSHSAAILREQYTRFLPYQIARGTEQAWLPAVAAQYSAYPPFIKMSPKGVFSPLALQKLLERFIAQSMAAAHQPGLNAALIAPSPPFPNEHIELVTDFLEATMDIPGQLLDVSGMKRG